MRSASYSRARLIAICTSDAAIGAEIGGEPEALASALQKIEAYARQRVNEDAERNPAMAHLFIINPLAGRGADNLFSTHPNTQNRIAQLMDMARRFGRPTMSASATPWGATPARNRGPWG